MPNNARNSGAQVVLFHSSTLTARGTEVALFDYAQFNEDILGNKSVVAFPADGVESDAVKQKFMQRFKTLIYTSQAELDAFAADAGAGTCYLIKTAGNDGVHVGGIRNVVHTVFKSCEPHGDAYAYISEWLSEQASGGRYDFVPHIIREPENTTDTMRADLGIPDTAHVYGTIGGTDSFKSLRATNAILDTIERDKNKFFIFVKTRLPEWFPWTKTRIARALATGRLIYIDEISDLPNKERFINSCDAMLHARRRGETFGIALGEFSIRQKPVIVWYREKAKDRCHYQILGDTAHYFRTRKELNKLLSQDPALLAPSDRYEQFTPKHVMRKFEQVFLSDMQRST